VMVFCLGVSPAVLWSDVNPGEKLLSQKEGTCSGLTAQPNLAGQTNAVNCGLGQSCSDGYQCCTGTALWYCCPKGVACGNPSDSRCKGTN